MEKLGPSVLFFHNLCTDRMGYIHKFVSFICRAAVPQSQFFGLKASKPWRGESSNLGVAAAGNMAQASTFASQENALEWVKKDKRRMLHVVYHVGDLDRTIKYIMSNSNELLF